MFRTDYFLPLETKRLFIRRLELSDAGDIFAVSSSSEVSRYVLWDTHRSVADSKGFIRGILHKYRVGDPASWAIALKEDGRVIGTIGFMWVNHENASAEVGYSIGVEHWNKGYMTEALQAVIDHGFGEMRLNRIEAQHDVENPASGRVMAKCGMRPEGTLRQRLYNKGKFIDVAIYSILRQEWRERQSPLR